MAYKVTEFPGKPDRILALEADTPEEIEALISRALNKGWQDYARGIEPDTRRPAAWLKKSADAVATTA